MVALHILLVFEKASRVRFGSAVLFQLIFIREILGVSGRKVDSHYEEYEPFVEILRLKLVLVKSVVNL